MSTATASGKRASVAIAASANCSAVFCDSNAGSGGHTRSSHGLTLAVVELRMVNVRHEAEPEMVVGVVEDQAIVLARCRPQAPPDDLHEQHLAPGRPRQDDAAHVSCSNSRLDQKIVITISPKAF